MRTMETKAVVDNKGILSIQIQTDLTPGERSAVVVLETGTEKLQLKRKKKSWADFPVIELGEIPKDENIRREDLY